MEDKKTRSLFTQDTKSADIAQSSIRCMGCMEEFSAEYEVCPICGYIVGTKAKSPYCLKPGTRLSGRYMIGKVIGQGGFGITYIGWDKIENRKVAIKEFFPNALSTRTEGETVVTCYNEKAENYFREGVRKMMDEGERLSKFSSHPNIVNICDNFEENNTAYIVMEYLDGKSLKDYAEENGGRISPEEAAELIIPVLDALDAMHKKNMIHRDIAPDNIFICTDGNIKLLDFGSARIAVQDAEKSLSVMVKPGYAPKEQYASRSKQGPWTDVYSVCATLYRLITGEAPVESIERDTTPLKTFASFGINGYDALENIIVKGLESDYEKRINNVKALKNVITKMFIIPNEQIIEENVPEAKEETDDGKLNKSDWVIVGVIFTFVALLIFIVVMGIRSDIADKSSPKILYSGELNESVSWSLNEEGLLLIEGTGDMSDFDYESEVGSVDCPWYNEREHIKSVVIENGITKIGNYSFYDCTGLQSITIPDSVTSIGYYAFCDCTNLTSITIPDSVTSIGNYAFYNTGYYNKASNWENDVLYIGKHLIKAKKTISGLHKIKKETSIIATWAFNDCDGLTSITIPDSVTSIGVGVFGDCTSLESITISDSVTSIGSHTFAGCTSLTSITIPDGVTSIGDYAFYDCNNLTSITIPDGVTSIGDCAFSRCIGLTSIKIPYGVTSIGDSTFWGCTGLTSITIPDSITSIGEEAFWGCTGLTSITIPDSVTSIGESAFSGCAGLTSITIPNGVTSIAESTFWCCTGLTSITIPDSVISIDEWAFWSCDDLKNVYYRGTEQQWNEIIIYDMNNGLLEADIHFNSYSIILGLGNILPY